MTGCLARTFGGEIPRVPGAVIKDTCLTVYIVLLGYYRIFESIGTLDGTLSVRLRDPVRTGPPWLPSGASPEGAPRLIWITAGTDKDHL